MVKQTNKYSVADIANYSIFTSMTSIDVSSNDYEPGDEFFLYVGDSGGSDNDVKVDTLAGETITVPVTTYFFLPVLITKVYSTGTDATNMFACRKGE